MNDPERVIQTLSLIRNQGVRFAIDDFGTGYSSFAYLKRLPVACIKIDKSFIHNIETDRDNAIIVKSITDLAHNLGLKVVAEGVESSPAKSLLTSFKCDEGQGFYFSRPITSKTLTDILLTSPNGRNIPGDAGAGLRIPQGCEMIDRLPLNAGRQIELHEE
jgi:EAL domain-containing protein (putative c-di-GMP-specific phosphodiesterase class I)